MCANLNSILCCAIKLEREKVLPKTEQKLHKREEKDKKKDRKGIDKIQCPSKKFKKLDDCQNGYNDEDQLEKSDFTEENEPPVCYVSDGSQSSHKRKREMVSYSECKVDGKKIKMKFSLRNPHQSEAVIGEKPSCSSNGRGDSNQDQIGFVPPVPEQKLCRDDGRKEQVPSPVPSSAALVSEQKLRPDVAMKVQRPSSSRRLAKGDKILRAALQYKTLLEDLLPPVLQPELNDDDDGDNWLLPKKQLGKPAVKGSDGNGVPCRASLISWPRSQYLPEAEIYALPYTVPF
ncbi:uncharacterized protein LOC120156980 [Hibiscus syriacus]|uniref:uncharacterized protein LOC120156980 n=1 Tax=Hibiscus syriacus TaxID=106335 RepID=UPI001923A8AD|nr:uncharacterized protein LOC120156980 [Hibiscus syriacus]